MSADVEAIYLSNDNDMVLTGLQAADTGSYLNAATVTGTLYDGDGTAVTGASGLTLSYVAASNGNYRGTIPSTVSLTAGARYNLEITATEGAYNAVFNVPMVGAKRGYQ